MFGREKDEKKLRPRSPLKIVSWNVENIKGVVRRGFVDWLGRSDADIVCLQETGMGRDEASHQLATVFPYRSFWNHVEGKKHSGVAVYTKKYPAKVWYKTGLPQLDADGRIIVLEYDNFTLVNARLPNGAEMDENRELKMDAYRSFIEFLKSFRGTPLVVCVDFNCSHTIFDVVRPKVNEEKAMFMREEREVLDKMLQMGFLDTFRLFDEAGMAKFTKWSSRWKRERNLGRRVDYIFVSDSIVRTVKKHFVLDDVKTSDHCPIGIVLDI